MTVKFTDLELEIFQILENMILILLIVRIGPIQLGLDSSTGLMDMRFVNMTALLAVPKMKEY